MPVTFQSVRFGAVEVPEEDVYEFPDGLIGLGGSRYALLDRNPGTGFLWLHCVEDPALALPVVSPVGFFADFTLELAEEEREKLSGLDLAEAHVYVTVRATPQPLDITANLRAPLLLAGGRGFQVINAAENAELRAPLFELAEPEPVARASSADAA
jgi:flagellar assembly factor FliW